MIEELIISFEYHSGKTVKELRKLELEKKNTKNKDTIYKLKEKINVLQQDYEAKLKPIALEIAFNIDSQMKNMSDDEIFEKYKVRDATSSSIGNCVYKICQKLERQPSHKAILGMLPERFRSN